MKSKEKLMMIMTIMVMIAMVIMEFEWVKRVILLNKIENNIQRQSTNREI